MTGDEVTAHRGRRAVRLVGEPGELLLFLFGRPEVAVVGLEGDPDLVAAVETTRFGL